MQNSVTWLHISDLHARKATDWNFREIADAIRVDMAGICAKDKLRPDFIFFTGDLAFGSVPGDKLDDQYILVQRFLDSILNAFDPPISKRNLYIVPGNHDIDRREITIGEKLWLRTPARTLSEISASMQSEDKQWRSWMDRFIAYRNFLKSYGLSHLNPDDAHLVWSDVQNVGSYRIGICGFNSAWSAADEDDKGKLWAGLEFQIAKNISDMGSVDLSFALVHHPSNWLVPQEDPYAGRLLRQRFQIVLHGHEHQEWVEESDELGLLISAGACYESSWMDNGYNIGHVNLESGHGAIRLREWDRIGRGWVQKNIARRTQNGVWPVKRQLTQVERANSAQTESDRNIPVAETETSPFEHYTIRYCKNTLERLDYLELFGCDIPRELQKHQLTVAYVSLNLSQDEDFGRRQRTRASSRNIRQMEDSSSEVIRQNASIQEVIEALPPETTRLVILGPAGAGKSTLLRWCAMYAARNLLDHTNSDGEMPPETGLPIVDSKSYNRVAWRKVPVLLRLRDFKDGKLPPAAEFPRTVAKHVQAAPNEWMTSILSAGRALILLDGVDELHTSVRPTIAREIEELVQTYPLCTYVITSRQGAIPSGWLRRIKFEEVSVQPMNRHDREEFIDKWYASAALELSKHLKGYEDLKSTGDRLKAELLEQSDLGLLASNPLVCAMICALYRERQDTLPESPSDLCEALSHMLIHRRERETSDLSDAHFDAVWRTLKYPQKKGLLAEIAWSMVARQVSTIDREKCREVVAQVLLTTPGYGAEQAEDVLSALIERSGLLRPAGDDQVEYIHNTLKEYLAACYAVENGKVVDLQSGADDPAWQPIILFALSLAPESFSSSIVSVLLERVPNELGNGRKKGSLNKLEKEKLATDSARAFFLVRCRKAVKRLAPSLSERIEQLTGRILPPAYMQDVEALALLGTKLLAQAIGMFDAPKWWAQQEVRTAARSLRLMRLIGGARAKAQFASIQNLPSGSLQLNAEWMLACTELADGRFVWPFADADAFDIQGSNVEDLRPLQNVSLKLLNIGHSKVKSLSFIDCRKIEQLMANSTDVSDLAPLLLAKGLVFANFRRCRVQDLSPLAVCHALRYLYLAGCPVASVQPLASLSKLEYLDLEGTSVVEVDQKLRWSKLRMLDVARTKIANLEFLSLSPNLERLVVSHTEVTSLDPIRAARSLTALEMRRTKIDSLAALGSCQKLRQLHAQGCPVDDLSPLVSAANLEYLSIDESRVIDLTPIWGLTKLIHLSLNSTEVNDVGCLERMTQLRRLGIAGTRIQDLTTLRKLPTLDFLQIGEEQVESLISMPKIDSIRQVIIVGGSPQGRALRRLREYYPGSFAIGRPLGFFALAK